MLNGLQQQGKIWNANERSRQKRLKNLLEKLRINQDAEKDSEKSTIFISTVVYWLHLAEKLKTIPCFWAFSLGSF